MSGKQDFQGYCWTDGVCQFRDKSASVDRRLSIVADVILKTEIFNNMTKIKVCTDKGIMRLKKIM